MPARREGGSPQDKFWHRVDKQADGCWLWTGTLSPVGYGRLSFIYGGQASWLAHRLAYTLVKGEIPDGLALDHLCRVRNCVNPEHLEPVTHAENTRRGWDNPERYKPWQTPGKSTRVIAFRPPPDLYDQAKVKAAESGRTMTDVLVSALRDYVDPEPRRCNGCANYRSPDGVSAGQSGADDGNRTR